MDNNMIYHTHITSKHNMLDLNLKEVWKYRDLIILFTKRSFSLLYKQTILGPACNGYAQLVIRGGVFFVSVSRVVHNLRVLLHRFC